MENSIEKGVLYVVATPIGNLKDMTYRAVEVLSSVQCVAAEDTRHSARLLHHYQINTPCVALHEHNERQVAQSIIEKIQAGETWALISDAGTPVVSDPGYYLIKTAREQGVKIIPLPGANAAITALCASGLPSDRFCFQGFIPAKATARQKYFQALQDDARTLIFYEAPHRLLESLKDMKTVFGADRQAVLARELTKTYETIRQDSLQNLKTWVQSDIHQQKGEIVILVAGQVDVSEDTQLHSEKILDILLAELPLKQAAALAAKITGQKKNYLYQRALEKTKA